MTALFSQIKWGVGKQIKRSKIIEMIAKDQAVGASLSMFILMVSS